MVLCVLGSRPVICTADLATIVVRVYTYTLLRKQVKPIHTFFDDAYLGTLTFQST